MHAADAFNDFHGVFVGDGILAPRHDLLLLGLFQHFGLNPHGNDPTLRILPQSLVSSLGFFLLSRPRSCQFDLLLYLKDSLFASNFLQFLGEDLHLLRKVGDLILQVHLFIFQIRALLFPHLQVFVRHSDRYFHHTRSWHLLFGWWHRRLLLYHFHLWSPWSRWLHLFLLLDLNLACFLLLGQLGLEIRLDSTGFLQCLFQLALLFSKRFSSLKGFAQFLRQSFGLVLFDFHLGCLGLRLLGQGFGHQTHLFGFFQLLLLQAQLLIDFGELRCKLRHSSFRL
mmetsp:Transcript_74170/g.150065  ORF Transcript_74170/g.150065 Transcript_74170/m.150065 type:complete len:282 (+) Transcript_74170:1385-2230(+)